MKTPVYATLVLAAGPALAHGDHAPALGPEHGLLHAAPWLGQPAALVAVMLAAGAVAALALRRRRAAPVRERRS